MRVTSIRILIILGVLLMFEAIVRLGFVNPSLFPPPTKVFSALGQLGASGRLWGHLLVTILEVVAAALISIPLGIIAGLLIAKHIFFGRFFGSFVYFLVSVPKSIFLPIFILALGVDFDQKVAFGVAQAFFVIAVNTAAATNNVPQAWVVLARSCGANTWQMYTRIYIPAMFPMVLEGVRLGVIFIITGVVLAEMYAARGGLGYMISSWADTFNLPALFAGILVAAILSIIINESIRIYERRVSTWRG